jgi:hypothetical protein
MKQKTMQLSVSNAVHNSYLSFHISVCSTHSPKEKIIDSGHHEGLLLLCSFQRPPGVLLVTHNATQAQLGTPVELITVHALTQEAGDRVMRFITAGTPIYNSSGSEKDRSTSPRRTELQRSIRPRPVHREDARLLRRCM